MKLTCGAAPQKYDSSSAVRCCGKLRRYNPLQVAATQNRNFPTMSMLSRSWSFLTQAGLSHHVRLISTGVPALGFGERFVPKRLKLDECQPDYKEFPERDIVNFPRPKIAMFSPKVRMGLFPESWFNFLYKKTGVTGPYLLGYGLLAFCVSKEWYVITAENNLVFAFIVGNWLILKGVGGKYAERYYNRSQKANREMIGAKIEAFKDKNRAILKESTDLIKRCESWAPMVFQTQRDQVFMQMEEEYRKRLVEYRSAVKKNLDYLVDLDETKKRLQRRHIVDWVVDQVRTNITEQVQKAAFKQCLSHLQFLSTKAQI